MLRWIWSHLEPIEFQTVLDGFGGSGSVSHWMKAHGKSVTYNDFLRSNFWTAVALVENRDQQLPPGKIDPILTRRPGRAYEDFVERTFGGIYFLDEENRTLDIACQNVAVMRNRHQRAIAYYALFQTAIAKRPYNLFHRKNLYMRTADVNRSFGNKATWDRSIRDHFAEHVAAANAALIDNGSICQARSGDVFEVDGAFDLVYFDPPYINRRGVGVDYHGFYHFLEGMADYANWPDNVDYESKHRRLVPVKNTWTNPGEVCDAFDRLFRRFGDSIVVISYRSDGIPAIGELAESLARVKPNVQIHEFGTYKYALSTNKRSREVLLIGRG